MTRSRGVVPFGSPRVILRISFWIIASTAARLPLEAQELVVVLGESAERPKVGALVTLVGADGGVAWSAVTDGAGRLRLRAPSGDYRFPVGLSGLPIGLRVIRVRKIGSRAQ